MALVVFSVMLLVILSIMLPIMLAVMLSHILLSYAVIHVISHNIIHTISHAVCHAIRSKLRVDLFNIAIYYTSHYMRQVFEALAYIHERNIIHRDLKVCHFYLTSFIEMLF